MPAADKDAKPIQKAEPLISAKEAARFLSIGLNKIYELARSGDLDHRRIGRQYRFDPEVVRNFGKAE